MGCFLLYKRQFQIMARPRIKYWQALGPPSEKNCDTIPRTPNTHTHEPSEPTLKTEATCKVAWRCEH